ncbi:putative ATP-grasp-modified RiPP [Nonomuraea lactucae]|uniref:putative ATP-grasp-modified RiPP n=1 Tax=Nonomuraea lactucae TaxID=2249762 RepID=UPI000DE34517|nr:putative ATP-grasp-modified RiPP [Nonomuraea lactucae]
MPNGQTTARRPWGLTRATRLHAPAPKPYATVLLDDATQVTQFFDDKQRVLDMSTFQTVTLSRPHDGAANAPQSADDSNTDQK